MAVDVSVVYLALRGEIGSDVSLESPERVWFSTAAIEMRSGTGCAEAVGR